MSAMRHSSTEATGSAIVIAHISGKGLKCAAHFSTDAAMLPMNRQPIAMRRFTPV